MDSAVVTVRPKPTSGRAGENPNLDRPVSVELPASKSHVQRALFAMGLAPIGGQQPWDGPKTLVGVTGLDATAGETQDILVTVAALRTLGAEIGLDDARGRITIHRPASIPTDRRVAPPVIDCRENGTCARMLGALVGVLGGRMRLDGAPPLRRRPMAALTAFLSSVSAKVAPASGGGLPLEIDAPGATAGAALVVEGATTTQVASGAMLGLAIEHREGSLTVRSPRARAYLDVTAAVASACLSVRFARTHSDGAGLRFSARPVRDAVDTRRWSAPRDASAAAFPAALACLLDRTVAGDAVRGAEDSHPDWGVLDLLEQLRNASTESLVEIPNLAATPDGFPALAVCAAGRAGVTVLRGAPALRHKESDRVAAMASVLRACGAEVDEVRDGITVRHGVVEPMRNILAIDLPADHRIVMATALLGAAPRITDPARGGIRIECAGAVTKSWPRFWDWLGQYARLDWA